MNNSAKLLKLRGMLQIVDPRPDNILSTYRSDPLNVIANLSPLLTNSEVADFLHTVAALGAELPEGTSGLRGIHAAQFFLQSNSAVREILARFQLARQEAESRYLKLMRAFIMAKCLVTYYEHEQVSQDLRGPLRNLEQMIAGSAEEQLVCAFTELWDHLPEFPTFRIAFSDAIGLSFVRR